MDSKQVLTRFEAERQALALMDHPNIAKVLDGGIHDRRPFFVMELVKGVPITDYCDARKLTPKERLELFVPVCQAIQHAHQKGIIHRDIKPSNVLIALYDDKPVVKVIDFGVAKATGGTLTEATIDTGFGGVVGTPQYMSPEQATFNNLDIDTRSDVYALGVLLYELLTGSPPFARKELEKKGLLEILRVVREEEPPRPSTKLSTADALPTLSANRGTEPKKLTGLLRNELDWIVMKALEKDRSRRYETANGFAADILRYLAGEPVQAHPPSTVYRLKKFVGRNKGKMTAASLVLFALLAGMAGTLLGLIEARRAKDRESQRAEGERSAKQEALAAAKTSDAAKDLAQQQRDRASELLSVSQAERGVKLMEQGDRRGLLFLVEARRSVEHLPAARDARTRLWQGFVDSLPKQSMKTFDPVRRRQRRPSHPMALDYSSARNRTGSPSAISPPKRLCMASPSVRALFGRSVCRRTATTSLCIVVHASNGGTWRGAQANGELDDGLGSRWLVPQSALALECKGPGKHSPRGLGERCRSPARRIGSKTTRRNTCAHFR